MIFVVVDEFGNKLSERTEESGSNNIAELLALREALIWANENGHDQINVKTDSMNNLSWISGRIGFKLVDRKRVLRIYSEIVELRKTIDMQISWVSRDFNLAGIYLENKH
jgi:ribonuclease HI